jgi:hypothetical protein
VSCGAFSSPAVRLSAFVDGDPFVVNSVVGRWEIRECNEVLAADA